MYIHSASTATHVCISSREREQGEREREKERKRQKNRKDREREFLCLRQAGRLLPAALLPLLSLALPPRKVPGVSSYLPRAHWESPWHLSIAGKLQDCEEII